MTGTRNAPPAEAARWHQRVLPVTALVLGLVGVGALASPGLRHQLALSAGHRTDPYVELGFARTETGPPVVCSSSAGRIRVEIELTSHLAETEQVPYVVAAGRRPERGSVTLHPGETARITRFLGSSARPYRVSVRLPSRDQRLHAHCPGAPA